jgi:hypothetical protein
MTARFEESFPTLEVADPHLKGRVGEAALDASLLDRPISASISGVSDGWILAIDILAAASRQYGDEFVAHPAHADVLRPNRRAQGRRPLRAARGRQLQPHSRRLTFLKLSRSMTSSDTFVFRRSARAKCRFPKTTIATLRKRRRKIRQCRGGANESGQLATVLNFRVSFR